MSGGSRRGKTTAEAWSEAERCAAREMAQRPREPVCDDEDLITLGEGLAEIERERQERRRRRRAGAMAR